MYFGNCDGSILIEGDTSAELDEKCMSWADKMRDKIKVVFCDTVRKEGKHTFFCAYDFNKEVN